ncbi:hypothetical protein QX233_07305 [Chryseobacterium gambrini]|uniref:Uncharacterized protein n=1 Tax=Chryseobacterium gambrini TaxID=373672 RepID=A0AAJ1VJB6_9FLAO|nr:MULTISPECIES: hypothetical protein [Chryseobacterium]MDN4012258.1 hypothetical protein [Chryseobacterium gambrini]QWA36870.1 hypothetical protein KKI44_13065 [Chryseobacterium sp. ZHDP1]
MKSILQKTQILLLLFAFSSIFSQQKMKLPKDVLFYMEINGKQLNQKINWQKLNPFLLEVAKEDKEKQASWNDYSKTGIKYDATQYHYANFNDSVKTYTAHFLLDNKEKFQEFINSSKKKGLEISKRKNYSYVNLDDELFVAWNDKQAVLKLISYEKPYKIDWNDEATMTDSAAATIDSAAIVMDSAAVAVDSAYAEKAFDYKEEIKYLKDDIQYLKEDIKEYKAEIAKKEKDIKYLEKHHKYPEEEKDSSDKNYSEKESEYTLPHMEEEMSEETEEDSTYQKKMDSLKIEKFKITKKLAEKDFDDYFSSAPELDVSKEILSFRDADSDVFVYTDYGRIVNNGAYGKIMSHYPFGNLMGKAYNSNSSYNLYFDNDKVRLVNSYQHKNEAVQKSINSVYRGKKNKKLTALINDKSIGYYAINVDGNKYFDLMYSLLKDSGEGDYQKEMELLMETMKIVLDEKAITKIAPGNGIFVLNELKSKTVEYTDYEYDDDYNEKEVKKTKEIAVPNFTFAFATENEGYWNRIFDMLTTNKVTAKKFSKNGDFYAFSEGKNDGYFDKLFFTVKDGIVYTTTSTENISAKNQSEISEKWAKDSAKYPLSGRFDIQKLMVGLEKEFKTPSERKTLDLLKKNLGEVYFKTEAKGEKIETEVNYNIKNASENSLMYFFDVFDEVYKMKESDKKQPIL